MEKTGSAWSRDSWADQGRDWEWRALGLGIKRNADIICHGCENLPIMGSTFMKATYLVDSTLPFLNMCDLALIALALRSGLAGDGSVGVRGGLEDEGG